MKCAREQYLMLVLALSAMIGTAYGEDRLSVYADTATATVEANGSSRNFLRLPELEYAIKIELQCDNGSAPVSLLVSVADTKKTIGADELQSGEKVEFGFTVPADQIAPIAIDGFCKTDNLHTNEQILIPAALSAQASLRCAGETIEQTTYASTPLDVELLCASGAEDEE